ncbi:MAG: hypothetical protein H6839_11995 [Planctomycetes bacterium]|nr:hypothetical protein [Planctomycetota bacterium]
METTQSEPQTSPGKPGKVWQIAVGGVVSLGAFLFGGFMALPAVLFAIPKLRRYWIIGLSLFVGTLAVRGLSLAGVNPLLIYARGQALDQLSEALGGEVKYDEFDGDATAGELRFTNLRCELPEVGKLAIDRVEFDAGLFLMFGGRYVVTGEGLHAELDASGGKLEDFLERMKTSERKDAELHLEGGSVEVYGAPTTALFELKSVHGETSEARWQLHVGMTHASVTIVGQMHEVRIQGGISISDGGGGLKVSADMRAVESGIGMGTLRGTLVPGGDSNMVCMIDQLQLGPLWARYRKVDQYDGLLRGEIGISGDLARLRLDASCLIQNYTYYHYTAMGLDPTHAFDLPEGEFSGRIELVDGEDWEFHDVSLSAPDAALATGDNMNARGGGKLVLNGKLPELTGRLDLVVTSGTLSRDITWSPTTNEKLSDVEPNLVVLAEQFPQLELSWTVDVQKMDVKCAPLAGTMTGKLEGTFSKKDGVRKATLRAGGELEMKDGKVKCLGLEGDFAGRVVFNPNAPTNHASLRASITGALGATPIHCEVTGDLQKPMFVFSGADMGLEELGRKLYSYSERELSPAEQVIRREECTRIFGWDAASKQNPFLARNSGKVFFSLK